jgi:uncharacterized membrane protein YpjA
VVSIFKISIFATWAALGDAVVRVHEIMPDVEALNVASAGGQGPHTVMMLERGGRVMPVRF